MPKIGILGTTGNTKAIVHELLQMEDYDIIYWGEELTDTLPTQPKRSTNPFSIIAEADAVVVGHTDEGSYGLMTECILALKPLIIDNLHRFTFEEVEELSKLSHEAEVSVIPYIDPRINACVRHIQQQFPEGIRFVHGTVKGNFSPVDNSDPLFTLMLFLTLMFRGSILRNHAETFYCARNDSPAFFQFTFTSGSAAIFYNPHDHHKTFTFDIVGKNNTRQIDPSCMEKAIDTSTDCYSLKNILPLLLTQSTTDYTFNLYDLKILLQAYRQITNVMAAKREWIAKTNS
jgi:hypothetical protein